MDDDFHRFMLKWIAMLATLICLLSWFILSWLLLLNNPSINTSIAWGFWGMFGVLSIAGLTSKREE